MSGDELSSLEEKLVQTPLDWGIRLALIQAYVIRDRKDEAKRLVRDSPDEAGPAPPQVQFRLHRLMTEGRSAAEEFAREDGHEVIPMVDVMAESSKVPVAVEKVSDKSNSASIIDKESEEEEFSGGAEGLFDAIARNATTGSESVIEGECIVLRAKPAVSEPPLVKVGHSKEREWELDNSRFVIESADGLRPLEREPSAGKKMSALSFALMSHIAIVLLLGAIVISIPRPTPPQIIAVNVAADQILDVPPKRVDKVQTTDRSAASAQAAFVISSTTPSPVIVPDFKQTNSTDVAAHLTDMKAGIGMSLEGEAEESDVNFFGIQSGGRKIVFIIDATPNMLVDEKGGMFAYDRVKDEVTLMLASLNRGTSFNILLYEGKRLKVYQPELVQARPSNVRLAIEWLDPLNRNYERLGLGRGGANIAVSSDNEPINGGDITGYAKAVQMALEMDVNTIFCIAGEYLRITRAMPPQTPPTTAPTPPQVDPKERAAWQKAVQETRDWLNKENLARQEKGQAPKVVVNFTALVRQVTGEAPPRARGGGGGGNRVPPLPPYTPEEIEEHVKNLVKRYYREENKSLPQLNLVLFLGKGEDIGDYKEHFRRLTRKNRGKLKILEGLEALKDVTADG